ncbi:MAG TPA: hypothetical protein VGG82_07840 [Casimicrobiaceae bacterium]|jgi:hypothetical protein
MTHSHEIPICDFCSAPKVLWRYHAHDFVMDIPEAPVDWGSDGDWAACDICHELIERDERNGLAYRSALRFAIQHDVEMKLILPRIRDLHTQFWTMRVGKAEPVI